LLARSIKNRFPYLDPLNHIQIELLKRHRAGDTDERVVQAIHLTINGIAAGLRNSGHDSLSHRPFLCGPGNTQFVRCHFGAFHPGSDFLERDIPRDVRRTMFRLHVDAEGREAAVVC
jgi:Phosphoenolpyruvate carboxylase